MTLAAATKETFSVDHSVRTIDAATWARGHGSTPAPRHQLPVVLSYAIVIVVMAWFVTRGEWRFFEVEHFGTLFDSQAQHLLQGRLDVHPDAIGVEAFVRDGKHYGYYGIVPALFRVPLRLLLPSLSGRWSRSLVLIAATMGVVYAHRILQLLWPIDSGPETRYRAWFHGMFILCIGLASTNLYMVSRPWMYSEAIVWAASFSLAFHYYLLRYLRGGSTAALVMAATMSLFAVLSRVTAAGTLVALVILCAALVARALFDKGLPMLGGISASRRTLWRHAGMAAAAVGITTSCNLAVTYGKFHTINGMPLQYFTIYKLEPHRLKITGGRPLHWSNEGTALRNYLAWDNVGVGPGFPWFSLGRSAMISPEARLETIEVFSGIPASTPGLFALACAGACAIVGGRAPAFGRLRLSLLAAAVPAIITMSVTGLAERYMHDFFPLIALCSAAGVARLAAAPHRAIRLVSVALLAPMVMLGTVVYFALAMENGHTAERGKPDRIDALFDAPPLRGSA